MSIIPIGASGRTEMTWRWGPGPVFAMELRAAARRWQTYALRSGFVAALFVAFVVVWWVDLAGKAEVSVRDAARVGERFYYGLIGTQLSLLLLAAPAATAGAIGDDRARGGLLHLMMTDLSDAEIILGKLFGRLTPVLQLMLCGMPVPGIVALLGGIDPGALLSAYVVTAGTTILGCTIALAVSIRASRPSEALLTTYVLLAGLLLVYPAWTAVDRWFGTPTAPTWLVDMNPFWLAFAPYLYPGTSVQAEALTFFAGTVAASAVLAGFAVARVRAVTIDRVNRAERPAPVRKARRRWSIGPSLDGNPVLWREWHRGRLSRRAQFVWGLYALCSVAFSVVAIGSASGSVAAWVNGLQVAIGLLLFSTGAVTSLAEERARGSLDLLLTTPLTTAELVWGKWWGTFRSVPLLTVLPVAVLVPPALMNVDLGSPLLLAGQVLAYGAGFTSLGLALATWVPRLGRAAFLSAAICVMLTVGWFVLVILLPGGRDAEGAAMGSPFFGAGNLTWRARQGGSRISVEGWALGWIICYLLTAGALMFATLRTFDRCLGRVRQRQPPQRVA
jgi:ABC-type transport system involved in multi-copper enzyme maturation permease subunit